MPETIPPATGVTSPRPPADTKQAWVEDLQQPVEMPGATQPADLAGALHAPPVMEVPSRQPALQAPVPQAMADARAPGPACPLTVTCAGMTPECEACASCCAGVGWPLLGLAVGLWACHCPVATVEGLAIAGGSAAGSSVLTYLAGDWGCLPQCAWNGH